MKKLLVLFTLMLYIASTNGMVRSIHLCMNKVVGAEISLTHKSHNACPKCGMAEEEKSCCAEEQSIVKLDSNHQSSEIGFEAPIFFLISFENSDFIENSLHRDAPIHLDNFLWKSFSVPIYKRDCSYLI